MRCKLIFQQSCLKLDQVVFGLKPQFALKKIVFRGIYHMILNKGVLHTGRGVKVVFNKR